MSNMSNLAQELKSKANPQKAKILRGFFKTKKGEYGEGDVFLGLTVPEVRKAVQKYAHLKIPQIKKHLHSKIHEERLAALLILVKRFQTEGGKCQKEFFDFYLKNTRHINNWDLVDLSAEKIIGSYLLNKNKNILYKLAKSKNLWERRIAILSTYYFIKNNKLEETFKISEMLLKDKHDLIHKAAGWMLREAGKRNQKEEEKFLKKYRRQMPRTMLRYAIERFSEKKRKRYLAIR